jgi:hypothetical protein
MTGMLVDRGGGVAALPLMVSAATVAKRGHNQRNLCKEILAFFHKHSEITSRYWKSDIFKEIEKAHCRIYERDYRLLPNTE